MGEEKWISFGVLKFSHLFFTILERIRNSFKVNDDSK